MKTYISLENIREDRERAELALLAATESEEQTTKEILTQLCADLREAEQQIEAMKRLERKAA